MADAPEPNARDLELAREQWCIYHREQARVVESSDIDRLAALLARVRAEEREACIDIVGAWYEGESVACQHQVNIADIERAIRERGRSE